MSKIKTFILNLSTFQLDTIMFACYGLAAVIIGILSEVVPVIILGCCAIIYDVIHYIIKSK